MEILIGFISLIVLLVVFYFLILPLIKLLGKWLLLYSYGASTDDNFILFCSGLFGLLGIGLITVFLIKLSKLLGEFLIMHCYI